MRLKLGIDVWECDCGAIIAIGRVCGCGKTYADILKSRRSPGSALPCVETGTDGNPGGVEDIPASGSPETPKNGMAARLTKYREPASEGKYTKSFLFKKPGLKNK